MEARTLTLNLVPGGVLPRINVSQYDTGVPVTATLYDGDTLYTIPTGAQVYVQGRKHDNTLYQYQCGTSGSIVTFSTTTQMTMVAGENIAEISIHYNGTIVGTINFVIYVEESALQDPTMSSVDDIPVIADLPELVERAETAADESEAALEEVKEIAETIDTDFERLDAAVAKAVTSADLAAFSATSADLAAINAAASESNAEAWASGQRGGVDVPSTDPTYHNNAKYYAVIASDGARIVTEFSIHPPKIGSNGNWWVYDLNTQQMVDTGIDASISLQIVEVVMLPPDATPYVTNSGTSTDALFHLYIPRGQTGAAGNGIDHIAKTGSEGRVDTYTIYYTNGTESTYTVTNGADGSGSVSTVNHVDPVNGNVQLKVTDLDVIGTTGQVIGLTSTNTLGVLNVNLSEIEDEITQLSNEVDQISENYSKVTPTVATGTTIAKVFTNGTTVDLLIPQSGGHQILTSTGSIMPQRSKLKFLNSDLTDDAANDTTIVSPRGGGAVIKIGDVEGASATTTAGTASVVLKWTDPEDIVVSGATLAEWAGTKVIRKAGSAPTSVSDGTQVVDSTTKNDYSATGLVDDNGGEGLTYGTTYYYRFFPYTTAGAVTDGSSVNATPDRASVAVPTFDATMTYDGTLQTATFTGYDSSEMTVSGNTGTDAGSYTATFNVKEDYKWSDGTRTAQTVAWSIGKANGSVTLSANSVTLDADHTSRTVTVSNATGNISVSSSDTSVATAVFAIDTITISSVNDTTGTATVTVNVAASSNYNAASASIAVSAEFKTLKIFAVHYSENNSDPNSCDYPSGYDNYGWTPMYVNLSTGVPVYGSWNPAGTNADKVRWLFPKSCMLKYDGTVDYYLDENDETKKADGTASDLANTSYQGNAMMEWAQDGEKIYWKILPDQDGKGWTFIVANDAVDKNGNPDSDMKPWNHYDCDGNVNSHFYTPKYNGSNISSVIRSLSGQTCYVNENDSSENTKCRANNKTSKIIWDKEVCADWIFVGLMLCLFAKSTATQAKYGYGYANANSGAIKTGTMDKKGLFYGESGGKSGVKVFGMENWWGNIWRRIRGLINASGTVKVKMTHGRQDGSTADDYNDTGSGYLSVGSIGGTSGGYISAMNITKHGAFPKTMSGSDSTYYCDGGWFNNGQTNVAIVGGGWNVALLVGAFACHLSATASTANSTLGAALSCKPLA